MHEAAIYVERNGKVGVVKCRVFSAATEKRESDGTGLPISETPNRYDSTPCVRSLRDLGAWRCCARLGGRKSRASIHPRAVGRIALSSPHIAALACVAACGGTTRMLPHFLVG